MTICNSLEGHVNRQGESREGKNLFPHFNRRWISGREDSMKHVIVNFRNVADLNTNISLLILVSQVNSRLVMEHMSEDITNSSRIL